MALGGGEALERPDFFELAEYVRASGIVPNLTTNGLVTTSAGDGTLGVIVPGTGILPALGVNVGSAGAPVLFNGALGTPSSGTVTGQGAQRWRSCKRCMRNWASTCVTCCATMKMNMQHWAWRMPTMARCWPPSPPIQNCCKGQWSAIAARQR